MSLPDNIYKKDAEGAGNYIRTSLHYKRGITPLDVDTFYFLGRWAGHWGRLALDYQAKLESVRKITDTSENCATT